MKRIGWGVLWFVVFFVVLYLCVQIGVALAALRGVHDFHDPQAVIGAAIGFVSAHLGLIRALDWTALLLAVAFAALGTWKGVLPGIRKKPLV